MSRVPKLSGKKQARKPKNIPRRNRTLIVVEGEKTEVHYFDYVNSALPSTNMQMKTVGVKGDPMIIVDRAIEFMKKEELEARRSGDRGNVYDQVWAVFDVDDHARIDSAIKLAEDNGIRIAISNPCFEIWLVLHHREQSAHVSTDEIQNGWYKCCGKKGKSLASGDVAGRFGYAHERAVELEKKHAREDRKFPKNNPSTGVHVLVSYLVDSANRSSSKTCSL